MRGTPRHHDTSTRKPSKVNRHVGNRLGAPAHEDHTPLGAPKDMCACLMTELPDDAAQVNDGTQLRQTPTKCHNHDHEPRGLVSIDIYNRTLSVVHASATIGGAGVNICMYEQCTTIRCVRETMVYTLNISNTDSQNTKLGLLRRLQVARWELRRPTHSCPKHLRN